MYRGGTRYIPAGLTGQWHPALLGVSLMAILEWLTVQIEAEKLHWRSLYTASALAAAKSHAATEKAWSE